MVNNDSFAQSHENDTQFMLSYELVCLLRWLMEHNEPQLKNLIKKALASGLKKEIKSIDSLHQAHQNSLEEIQMSIIDFFGLLEAILLETMHEQAVQATIEKNLMPAIEHIDARECDTAIINHSIERVVSKIDNASSEHAQEMLFQEILRRWKPNKKKTLN